jgi:transcriptional regulator with XRE-family HTH domain
MSPDPLVVNLRLLSSYGRSVSDICRRAKFNRQQFTKYLSGAARPSLASLRRICDYFGVEEHEILQEPDRFRALVRLRPPRLGGQMADPISGFLEMLADRHDHAAGQKLAGYYFLYLQDEPRAPTVTRSLLRLSPAAHGLAIKGIERFPGVPAMPPCLKYSGFAVVVDGRVHVAVHEVLARRSIWFGIHYTSDFSGVAYLSGLSLGTDPQGRRDILASRKVLQFLGTSIDIKAHLRRCGLFSADSPELDPFVRHATRNDMAPNESVFVPR